MCAASTTQWDDAHMASEANEAQEYVVLASLDSRPAAERMLASLGRGFRSKARKGQLSAFVVSANKDGSLKLTQSRVLTAGGVTAALMRVPLALMVGFLGLFSATRGAQSFGHAVHVREARVGSDEQAAHAIIARAGAHAAITLVCCEDADTRDEVAARAAERASDSWDGSRTEFLAALDPGSKHDWVRTALDKPPPRTARY